MNIAALTQKVKSGEALEEPPPHGCESTVLSQYKYIKDLIAPKDFLTVNQKYPFVVTPYYLSIAQNSLDDPVMKQLCPTLNEIFDFDNILDDPLAEEHDSPVPGLVHRYPDRVLMVVTNVCFMNCRHCTRKRLWKQGGYVCNQAEIGKMLEYINRHGEVRDVIISGGDPFTLTDDGLEDILCCLRSIPHVEIIRVGTRAPVVNPARITPKLCSMLKKYRPLWINTQFNHAHEITAASGQAINNILEAGIPVNNQSVLLRGINDTPPAMLNLCQGLLKIGVRPYYLFHCDPVKGTAHFRTSISRGVEIIEAMRGFTSGLAIPTYVVDAVDGGGKIPVGPDYVVKKSAEKITLKNYAGRQFEYRDTPVYGASLCALA